MEHIVEMKNIKKSYSGVKVLDDVTLNIKKGEQIAIIGSSGAGKSTLMRCINHLETIDSGSIAINGTILVETGPDGKARYKGDAEIRGCIIQTAMVFQHFNLFGHLTCLENIMIAPIQTKKEKPAEVRERAFELLNTVGLESKAGAYPGQLSGGQKQRIAIARALAMRPDILLFDEPTSALDPEVTGEVLKVIRKLASDGYTMALITHEMNFAREVAERVIFMDSAKIVEDGTPQQIFENPQSERLQSFLRAVI